MKSRLMSQRELDSLSRSGSLQALIAALAKTAYHRPLEAALVRASGREAVQRTVRSDMEITVAQLRRFYRGKAAEKVSIILRANDVHNLKAVLRGLSSRSAPDEITLAFLPAAELRGDVLGELVEAGNPRTAIDLLASSGNLLAQPLIRLRGEHPGAGTPEMELRLDQWCLQQALKYLRENEDSVLLRAIQMQADVINIETVLRLAARPQERQAFAATLGASNVHHLFVGPGRVSLALLTRAASQDNVAAAVTVLADTPFARPLTAGMVAYRQNGRLRSFERALYRWRLAAHAALISQQPLGIGVVLGYLALKTNEINNLRWITNGVYLDMKAEKIRAELVYAP